VEEGGSGGRRGKVFRNTRKNTILKKRRTVREIVAP
jgi:hypothetical protein